MSPTKQKQEDACVQITAQLPLMLRIKGTVILKIWPQVFLVTLYAAGIVSLHNYVDGFHMNFPTILVSILGSATGLLLVFRNNTAYDRYYEGRRLWSTMAVNIRNMTRAIWVAVNEKPDDSEDILEKVQAIKLLVAFAYAVKNNLRGIYSPEENVLFKECVGHMEGFGTTPSSSVENSPKKGDQDPLILNVNPKLDGKCKGKRAASPAKKKKKCNYANAKKFNFKAYECAPPINVPIEISYYLSSYVQSVRLREMSDGATISTMNSCISSLVDCFTSLERILRTPIPLVYSVHLHHTLWIYILALPFQLVGSLNWFAIPTVTISTFALLGILSIGWEIENPFGYDENDLPLDEICEVIQTEAQTVMAKPLPPSKAWVMSKRVRPLAHRHGSPNSDEAEEAREMASTKSVGEIRTILAGLNAVTSVNQSQDILADQGDRDVVNL